MRREGGAKKISNVLCAWGWVKEKEDGVLGWVFGENREAHRGLRSTIAACGCRL